MTQALGPLVVFVLALGVRAALVLHSRGGAFGDFGYDSSVYYSAADALIHGRMPYVDFIMLHPPALMLALTPFAAFGSVTSDHLGYVVANGAFEIVGAINAVLVILVSRRAGAGRFAAVVGGTFYAAWPGAADAEVAARLEPLGNMFLLGGLLVLVGAPGRAPTTRRMLLCGALLGAAAVTKIWWIVPLLIIVAWTACRDRRQGVLVLAGAAVGSAVIAGPFFLRSPAVMWRMVVADQLGRPSTGESVRDRLFKLTSLHLLPSHTPRRVEDLFVLVIGALAVTGLVRAWRVPALRVAVALAVAQLLVLMAAPTFFGYYADYLTPASALVLAGAMAAGRTATASATDSARVRQRVVGVVCILAVVTAAVGEVVVHAPSMVKTFPGVRLADAAAHAHLRCVMADSPMALIELDVLSRDLANGCPDRVDVSGSTYDVDKPVGPPVPRVRNHRWQHALYRYLTSGNAEIVIRPGSGISPRTRRRLDRFPVVARAGRRVLRRTP